VRRLLVAFECRADSSVRQSRVQRLVVGIGPSFEFEGDKVAFRKRGQVRALQSANGAGPYQPGPTAQEKKRNNGSTSGLKARSKTFDLRRHPDGAGFQPWTIVLADNLGRWPRLE
jgi:hypothetical protein